jgi:hypothetical protein
MTVNGRTTGLILCAWLLVPALAAAQSAPAPQPTQRAQMDEDIEILRRLLNSKLQGQYPPAKELARAWTWNDCMSCHATAGNTLFRSLDANTMWPMDVTPYLNVNRLQRVMDANRVLPDLRTPANNPLNFFIPQSPPYVWVNSFDPHGFHPGHWTVIHPAAGSLDTEGVYLKGQGVVYTLTLPPPQAQGKSEAAKPAPKPASDWDRVRHELRHEKPEPEHKERPRKEPTLAEIILQVLLENGHHFGQLGDNEGLTVVVTFRGDEQPQAKAADPAPQADPATQKSAAASTSGNPGQDYELLGDLHLKQGKAAEAERAYQQAISESKNPQRTVTLWGKYAQVLLSEGKVEEARRVLEQALNEKKKERADPPPARPRAATAPTLPGKLIITASKKLLDQAAGGKMSLDDFQKAASVEYVNVAPPQE